MIDVEICVDDRLELFAFRRVLGRGSDALANLGQALFERFGEQILLAVEMPIEAAVGQAQITHEIADPRALAATAAEAAGRRADDSLVCVLFVICAVPHTVA